MPSTTTKPKRKSTYLPIPQLLAKVDTQLHINALLPASSDLITAALKDSVTPGRQLHQKVQQQIIKCRQTENTLTASLQNFNTTYNRLKKIYTTLISIGRRIIDNPRLKKILNLTGRRPKNYPALIHLIKSFTLTLPKEPTAMAAYQTLKIKPQHIQQLSNLLAKVEKLHTIKNRNKIKTTHQTKQRNRAVKELKKWYGSILIMYQYTRSIKNLTSTGQTTAATPQPANQSKHHYHREHPHQQNNQKPHPQDQQSKPPKAPPDFTERASPLHTTQYNH